jgi:hypothetical protein
VKDMVDKFAAASAQHKQVRGLCLFHSENAYSV